MALLNLKTQRWLVAVVVAVVVDAREAGVAVVVVLVVLMVVVVSVVAVVVVAAAAAVVFSIRSHLIATEKAFITMRFCAGTRSLKAWGLLWNPSYRKVIELYP